MRGRVLTVRFAELGGKLLALPEGTPEEIRRAERARDLIGAIIGDRRAPELTAQYLMTLDERVFADARAMCDGDTQEAAMRAALEAVDPDVWDDLLSRVARMEARPDPAVGPEFV